MSCASIAEKIKRRLEFSGKDHNLSHPCKGKCSGWMMGFEEGLRVEHTRMMKELEPVFEALEALQFYADGAGLDLVDEGRNYQVDYVAYENDFRRDAPLHLDKPVGTMAKLALEKLGGGE